MRLPKEAIEELKEIYKKEFGEELSDKDAQEMAHRLMGLFQLLRYRPGLTDTKRANKIDSEH